MVRVSSVLEAFLTFSDPQNQYKEQLRQYRESESQLPEKRLFMKSRSVFPKQVLTAYNLASNTHLSSQPTHPSTEDLLQYHPGYETAKSRIRVNAAQQGNGGRTGRMGAVCADSQFVTVY